MESPRHSLLLFMMTVGWSLFWELYLSRADSSICWFIDFKKYCFAVILKWRPHGVLLQKEFHRVCPDFSTIFTLICLPWWLASLSLLTALEWTDPRVAGMNKTESYSNPLTNPFSSLTQYKDTIAKMGYMKHNHINHVKCASSVLFSLCSMFYKVNPFTRSPTTDRDVRHSQRSTKRHLLTNPKSKSKVQVQV